MASAEIEIDGSSSAGKVYRAINTLVQLSNADTGGESTYLWSIVDQPDGVADALSSAVIENPTITPLKEGTYLLQLIVNLGLPTEVRDRKAVTIRHVRSQLSEPAAQEQYEADAARGWRVQLSELYDLADRLASDPGLVVGVVSTTATVHGVYRYGAPATILSGLPGEREVASFEPALATSAANLRGPLALLVSHADGSAPVVGQLGVFRVLGLSTESATGTPTVGDSIFVNDAGRVALSAGANSRRCGSVVSVGGGSYRYAFTGTDSQA